MRRAFLGGLTGLLLISCSSAPAPTTAPLIAPVPACTSPADPELVSCATSTPAIAIDATIEYGPELTLAAQERDRALWLARDYLAKDGFELRIAQAAKPVQGVNGPVRISFLSGEMYRSYRASYGGNGGAIGCANLLTRDIHINTGKIHELLHDACPAERTAIVAATIVHEVGHLFGLVHIDAVAPHTSVPVNDARFRPNVMLSSDLSAERAAFDRRLCASDLDALTADDLPIAMEPIQRAQMRSAAISGSVWELMRESGFDYEIYEKAYRAAIGSPDP